MRNIKVMIAGGGTGGHVYPAIALADALKALAPGTEMLFVGVEGKMEMRKVPEAGYRIEGLPVLGLPRKPDSRMLAFPFQLLRSLRMARRLVREFCPDLALGVGGYASVPALLACLMAGLPVFVQEQNSHAGLANRFLGKWARKIFVAYPGMGRFFGKEKIVLSGNPVRRGILANIEAAQGRRAKACAHFGFSPDRQVLLVTGGSLGARTLNESMAAHLGLFAERGVQLLWQTGPRYAEEILRDMGGHPPEGICVCPFIERMDLAHACADAVVSRAGALSISELALSGKACVFVPSPHVAEDHQSKNARALVAGEAALLIPDSEARQRLVPEVLDLLEDAETLRRLRRQIAHFAKPKAAEDIAGHLLGHPAR